MHFLGHLVLALAVIIAAMVVAFAFRFTPVAKRSFSTINPGAPISTTFVRSITGPGNRFGPSGGGRSSITGTNSDYRRARDARITLRRRKRSTSNLPQPRWLRIGVEKLFAKRVITSLLFVHRVERFGDLRLGVVARICLGERTSKLVETKGIYGWSEWSAFFNSSDASDVNLDTSTPVQLVACLIP